MQVFVDREKTPGVTTLMTVGDSYEIEVPSPTSGLGDSVGSVVGLGLGAAGAYHGYKRNKSVLWAFLWGMFAMNIPVIAVPVAIAQGFGKSK